MSELATYLHDHLAGATAAIDVLTAMRDDHAGEPLGGWADERLTEIVQDRETLEQLAHRMGEDYSKSKEAVAWIGAKLTRAKLAAVLRETLACSRRWRFWH
jgi:hypothetical protein